MVGLHFKIGIIPALWIFSLMPPIIRYKMVSPNRPNAGTANPPMDPPMAAILLVLPRSLVRRAWLATLTFARVAPFIPIIQAVLLISAPITKVIPAYFSMKRESTIAMIMTTTVMVLYSVAINSFAPSRMVEAIFRISLVPSFNLNNLLKLMKIKRNAMEIATKVSINGATFLQLLF